MGGIRLLEHRGPDDRGHLIETRAGGTLGLGHTRLSIIDLSPGGHQPMRSHDGRYVMAYNGEIYNYRELRKELTAHGHQFSSDSDTEVLLAAWQHWGPHCLRRLIGMFAFVVYDRTAGRLTAVRDAFGIKPFFFARDGDAFVFASELPALLAIRDTRPVLDRQRAHDYLVHGIQDSGGSSFIEGVAHLPPAHLLHLDLQAAARPVVERWWKPPIAETSAMSFNAAADAVRELFLSNVRLHLRSDVPVGAALSGGIDSSALIAGMRHVEPDLPVHTFSFIAEDDSLSEEYWVDLANAHIGAHAHKVRVRTADIAADLPDLIRAQGEPFSTTSMYAQYRVFRAAHEAGITVVLEGQGADELMGGYEGYPGQRMLSLLERGEFLELRTFAAKWQQWPGRGGRSAWRALVGQLLPDGLYRKGLRFAGVQASPEWLDLSALRRSGASLRAERPGRHRSGRGRRMVEVQAHALTDSYLPSLLRHGDRNAMRFSIENRVPFLTLPMAELLLSLPESYLISRDGETKHVFRAAMRGIVPEVILRRRDKIGFETPMRSWLSTIESTVRHQLERTTLDFLDPDAMVRAFEASLKCGVQGPALVWRMINLCWWARMYGVQ